jgi:hypothetical protein
MRLGLITDVHEHVDHLRLALQRLCQERADQIVLIGDVFELGDRIEETCRLLAEAGVIGVWGNHDFGLSFEPDTRVRRRYPAEVIDFMTSLRPRLELGGCYFAHIEPWLNPEDLCDLWFFDGFPNDPVRLQRIFDAVPQRVMFAGHYHRWLLARPDQITDWLGTEPVDLSSGRAFAVIGAVCDGYSALFDTDTGTLTPFCDTPATLSQEPGSGM